MFATSPSYRSPRERRSGAALIVVLLLLAFFAGLIADFLYNIRINTYIAANQMQQLQGKYVAEAGINAAKGLLLHSSPFSRGSRSIFQNDYMNLLQCRCYSGVSGGGKGSRQNQKTGAEADSGSEGLDGQADGRKAGVESGQAAVSQDTYCGEWSLAIDYPFNEYALHLEIYDEQARLNLNALAKKSMDPDEQGAGSNDIFKPVVAELIKLRLQEVGMELDDQGAAQIVDMIVDWVDFGQSGGGIDSDLNQSYQDGDMIYSNKNGPMDTVSELKMIPGITDDVYLALKDFITVYPYNPETGVFNMRVNTDMASIAVIYALIRGSSYQQDNPTIDENEALKFAQEIVDSGMDDKGFIKNREIPTDLKGRINAATFMLNSDISQVRWYHVKSTALSPDGVYYTIDAVLMVIPGGSDYRFLYWREG